MPRFARAGANAQDGKLGREMNKERTYKHRPGISFGTAYPVRFERTDPVYGAFVYVYKTGEILHKNLKEWEAMKMAMQENEARGFCCRPDMAAIDSTP